MSNNNPVAWHDLGLGSTAYSVAGTGDFNNDGSLDVLWHNAASGDTGYWAVNNGAVAWHGLGAGSTAYSIQA